MRVTGWAMAVLASCGLWGCATVAVIEPGYRAVLQRPDGELVVLGEGVEALEPNSVVQDFDLRQQLTGRSVAVVTADGVPVVVGNPIATWAWAPDELVDAARTVSEARAVVAALVGEAVAQVLSGFVWKDLDTPHLREAEAQITARAAAALRPRHLVLSSVSLKGLTPRAPQLARAIAETEIWKERSTAAASRLEVARQQAEAARAGAQGFADSMSRLAPTLTREVLDRDADRAWAQLLAAPHTTVDVSTEPSPVLEVTR
jgi:hypothetical protein